MTSMTKVMRLTGGEQGEMGDEGDEGDQGFHNDQGEKADQGIWDDQGDANISFALITPETAGFQPLTPVMGIKGVCGSSATESHAFDL